MVLGGDGTINEVVNGLAGSPVPMAVLPGGTANCLAVELGLGVDVEHASGELQGFVPRPVALGRITAGENPSRYFLLMCGAGLDARIVYDVSGGLKRAVGKLAYWIAGVSQIPFRVENFGVRVEGQVIRCGFMLASRIRNYGGDLEIARGASLSQDHFEVVLFEGSVPLRYAWYMLGVATKRVQQMRGVRVMRAQRVEILGKAHLQIDGEHAGYGPATIEIVPASLHLLLPPAYG
jgi:diacylglycerol kinase (ATP)